MIQLIVELMSTISNCFYYLFWTSYSIGKFISWILGAALNIVLSIWRNGIEAGTVFSEDFLLFLKDFVGVTTDVFDAGINSITTSCTFVYSVVQATWTTITELFFTGTLHTTSVGNQCISSFAAMMNALKNLFVLIGNGMWFVLTLLPNTLLAMVTFLHQMSQICFEISITLMEEIWSHVKGATEASINYFLDVPLQALIGCSFIVLLVMYRRVTLSLVVWIMVRLIQYLRSRILTAFRGILSSLWRRNNNRSRLNQPSYCRPSAAKSPTSSKKPNSTDDNACVICRDEPRNIVLMPCRHLCLCVECSGSVRTIRTCPLCRIPIKNTLSVFT